MRMMFNVMQMTGIPLETNDLHDGVWFCVCCARGLAAEIGAGDAERFGQAGGGSPRGRVDPLESTMD